MVYMVTIIFSEVIINVTAELCYYKFQKQISHVFFCYNYHFRRVDSVVSSRHHFIFYFLYYLGTSLSTGRYSLLVIFLLYSIFWCFIVSIECIYLSSNVRFMMFMGYIQL